LIFLNLFDGLVSLGLESGRRLDLSDGVLTEQDIETFQYWANYFSNDEGAKAICDKLGRLNEVEATEKIERVSFRHRVQKWLPDTNSREEIVGIKLGRDIEHALPSELALLSDPETALLFELKHVEGQLMSYDLQELQQVEEIIEKEEDQSVDAVDEKGLMILCIDTSGSMHSGTDAAPALRHVLLIMGKQAYEKADILVISDFIMGGMPSDILDKIEAQRLLGSQFYSLVVGSCFMSNRFETLFDHEWVFNPSSSAIIDLVSFHNKSEMLKNKELSFVKGV
jgi:uncharacterized protein with von Willebrand factor type A (vWA) domain